MELNKIDEIANRLRQYEIDNKPRYFNLKYINQSFKEPQLIAERISGEKEFRNRVNEAINVYSAEKIIVEEFNQKSKNVHEPVNIIEIQIKDGVTITYPPAFRNKPPESGDENEKPQRYDPFEKFGGFDGFKQELRSEVAKEYQLIREQEEKHKVLEENARLRKENGELNEDNTKLFELNQELGDKVRELQKYVPENLKIGDMSLTKVLGSILGTATETMVKSIVVRKPEKVKELLGETAFEQLSGLWTSDDEEDPDEDQGQQPVQELQSVPPNPGQEENHLRVANAIHELNTRIPSPLLAKIQLIYYHFLNEDETINEDKLDEIMQYLNKQKKPDDGTE